MLTNEWKHYESTIFPISWVWKTKKMEITNKNGKQMNRIRNRRILSDLQKFKSLSLRSLTHWKRFSGMALVNLGSWEGLQAWKSIWHTVLSHLPMPLLTSLDFLFFIVVNCTLGIIFKKYFAHGVKVKFLLHFLWGINSSSRISFQMC